MSEDDLYVKGNVILFTLFGTNPDKELLAYAKEKIKLLDEDDFPEWLDEYEKYSNINSTLIDDIFVYEYNNDT